jgi:putative ABC transport system permease protein
MVALGLALSMAAGAAFGIVPAVQVSGVNPGDNLKDAGRGGGAGRRERRFRGALVAAEIAISLVLLVSAGLLVRSFWSMLQVRPGLDPARVGFVQIWIPVPKRWTNPYGTPHGAMRTSTRCSAGSAPCLASNRSGCAPATGRPSADRV